MPSLADVMQSLSRLWRTSPVFSTVDASLETTLTTVLSDTASLLPVDGAAVYLPHSSLRPFLPIACFPENRFPVLMTISPKLQLPGALSEATLRADDSGALGAVPHGAVGAVPQVMLFTFAYRTSFGAVVFSIQRQLSSEHVALVSFAASEISRLVCENGQAESQSLLRGLGGISRLTSPDSVLHDALSILQASLNCREVHLLIIRDKTVSGLQYEDCSLRGSEYARVHASTSKGALFESVHRGRAMLLSRAANAADPTTFTGVALPASSLSPDDHVTRTFLSDFPRHATAKSISLMPIMRGGAIDAILKVVDSERSDYFGMRHLWLMQVAAGPLSSVILDLETQARALGDMRGDPRMLLENVEGLFFYREIATGIFHQLRNLLGDIGAKLVAAGTMLDMRAPDTNGARDEMDQSQKRVLEARTLIDSIERRGVSFSLRPRRCELVSDVVRPVLEKRRAPIEKAGIHLVQTLTDDKYRIEVDPAMMQEALTNLVNNSITALRKHASGRRELFVAVRQRRDEGKVVVVIRDTGIGMTAEDLGRVGTPLFTSDPERGSGLGVYFARKVVEKFRGELRYVYSQPEKGTEVHVSLPLVG